MSNPEEVAGTARQLFDREEVEGVLNGSFYTRTEDSEAPASGVTERDTSDEKKKPTHYKVICISMYTDALGKLDDMVRQLKARGYTKANRSALIRHALSVVDLEKVPRGM